VTRAARTPARRCRNVCLLDVATVYGDDLVELRPLLRSRNSVNWLVVVDLRPWSGVNTGELYFEQTIIHDQNVDGYRKLLARVTDESQRQVLLTLLAEEEAKQQGLRKHSTSSLYSGDVARFW